MFLIRHEKEEERIGLPLLFFLAISFQHVYLALTLEMVFLSRSQVCFCCTKYDNDKTRT